MRSVCHRFRWDLFLRDYRAFLDKQSDSRKATAAKLNVDCHLMSGLFTGRVTIVSPKTLNKILEGMKMYYEFYCEEEEKPLKTSASHARQECFD